MAASLRKRSLSTLSDDDGTPVAKPIADKSVAVPAKQRVPDFGMAHPRAKLRVLKFTPFLKKKPDAGPLNMRLVPHRNCKRLEQDVDVKLITSPIVRDSFGCIRCFGATVRANQNYLSKRGAQDLATQIYYWDYYIDQCKAAGVNRGKYLNPDVGEFLSGLPAGWSVPFPHTVSKKDFWAHFPARTNCGARQKAISVFSGIGGLELGLRSLNVDVIAYVESDEYCRDVLAFRMADGFLSSGAIYSDITTYQPTAEEARAHGIVGGFPCQGVCKAGKKLALDDERTGLIVKVFELIDCTAVSWALLENVKHLLSPDMRELWTFIVQEFEKRGWAVVWCTVSGKMAGLHMKRDRIFMFASKKGCGSAVFEGLRCMSDAEMIAEAHKCHHLRRMPRVTNWLLEEQDPGDGERLHALGNIVIPKMAELACHILGRVHSQACW